MHRACSGQSRGTARECWSSARRAGSWIPACANCRTSCARGDALVVNDTKVIAARLEGVRVRGDAVASIEATLIERVDDCRWRALARPAKKLKVGERIRFGESSESMACLLAALDAEVEDKGEAGEILLRFRLCRSGAG